MEVWYGAEQVPTTLSAPGGPGSVVAIGVFDGVHRGHQAILGRVVERAHELAAGGRRPLAVAVTFDPHPRRVHRPEEDLPLIASLTDRLSSLEGVGLDAVLVIAYDLDFAAQGPREFVRTWLEGLLGVRALVVGGDVRFGRSNSGDAATLEEIGAADGFEVEILGEIRSGGGRRWSSTWIRELLASGDVAGAARVLGRSHRIRGQVVHGFRRGREIGFPTANLTGDGLGEVPADGVYAGWLVRSVPGSKAAEYLPAAISVGTNPHFEGTERTVEVHALGRSDLNLYGESIAVDFVEYLRPMLSFESLDGLLRQMDEDLRVTAEILGVPTAGRVDPAAVTAT